MWIDILSHMNVTIALLGFSASGFRNPENNVVAKRNCVAKQHVSQSASIIEVCIFYSCCFVNHSIGLINVKGQ